eukprot:298804-Chlamydomonas_euryale.AAC.1
MAVAMSCAFRSKRSASAAAFWSARLGPFGGSVTGAPAGDATATVAPAGAVGLAAAPPAAAEAAAAAAATAAMRCSDKLAAPGCPQSMAYGPACRWARAFVCAVMPGVGQLNGPAIAKRVQITRVKV